MKKFIFKKKEFILLVLIIILASALRLWMLGQVPISMSDDEIREISASYSIAHTGKDVYGNFLPVVFNQDGFNTYGLVPIYARSLFFLFLDLNSFTGRLPYALSSIFSVILLYLIVKKLFNGKIALISSFALSISVWQLQLSRIAIETNISLFLYLLGIFIFLYSKNKTKLIVLSMTILFLAFYSYSAFKIFFLPLMFVLIWYKFKELTKKHILIIIATIIFAFVSFGFLSITQNASKYSSNVGAPFFFLDKSQTALSVELERRASNEPQIIKAVYHNKFTYWSRIFATNYLTAFSPQYLFLNQEASGIYSIWGRGEMYIFELPFFIIGFLFLFLKKRREFYLVLLFLLISPLPSALGIGTPTWTSRSGFMVFWLYTFVGAGIYYLLTFKKQNYRYLAFILIILFYLYAVVGYVFQYYSDWSRSNAKYFSKSTQDLIYVLNNYKSKGKKVIVAGTGGNTFLHYAFYNKLDPKLVQANMSKNSIKFDNFTFQKDCLLKIPDNLVYIAPAGCKYEATPSSKIKTFDTNEAVWNIYEK